jgi:hypothetical protein
MEDNGEAFLSDPDFVRLLFAALNHLKKNYPIQTFPQVQVKFSRLKSNKYLTETGSTCFELFNFDGM